jgi:DNA modification methylase
VTDRAKIIRSAEVSISDLKQYPGNARRGDVDMIRESLRVNGQYKQIIVQESTGYVLAGNHTLQAAKGEHWDKLHVTFVECSDETAQKINLVDNRSNDVATYDMEALTDLLKEIPEFEGTGFTEGDLDDLLAEMGGGFGGQDPNHAPPLPEVPDTRLGDWWELGDHWLWCGKAENFDVGACGTLADLVVTDPPYTISYQQNLTPEEAAKLRRRTDGKQIEHNEGNDADAIHFVITAAEAIQDALRPGGAYYIFGPPGPDVDRFTHATRNVGLLPKQVLIWLKDVFVFGRQDYHYQHESIVYGWKPGAAHNFVDDRTKTSILSFDRPKQSKEHPTMKPLELIVELVKNSSQPGDVVVDLFAGSGTTLIACQETRRKCISVELDPAYCDVTCQRFERLTGIEPILHREGE